MKSIVARYAQRIVLILAIASVVAVPAMAKRGNRKLDSGHSTARILLGSNVINIGVARVGGNLELDAARPSNSVFDLSIDPAGGKLVTFKSRRVTISADGKLEVSGDLTLSREVRQAILNPAEDYSGPVYGEPTMQIVTHEVTFAFPLNDQAEESEITGEARMFGENFPELFAALSETNWQPVVQDKACEMPQASEDYAGAICTGKVVESKRSAAVTNIGDDYQGYESAAPQGNLMTIVLNLRLTREISEHMMTARKLR